jgi:hypothetical protein
VSISKSLQLWLKLKAQLYPPSSRSRQGARKCYSSASCGPFARSTLLKEVGLNKYAANKITKAIALPALESGFCLCYDNAARPKSPLFEAIQYFKTNGYQSPTIANDGPYQRANDCVGVDTFDHWIRDPAETLRFNTYMEIVHSGHPMWFEWYGGLEDLLNTTSKEDVLLVDIAGGHGHHLNLFAKKTANVPGKLVLQDLKSVIGEVGSVSLDQRIEKQIHDFFSPQPIIGARIYYLHFIFHDWPDSDCIRIMERIRDAMKPGYSRLLINDAILPDTKRYVKSTHCIAQALFLQ